MDTLKGRGQSKPPTTNSRRRLFVAAAGAAVAVLIGAVVFGFVADGGDSDAVEAETAPAGSTPTTAVPTTIATPTTVTPTTVPMPTTVPPTTVPPDTTAPATTSPPTTLPPPQTLDATLIWDGETCSLDGPAEANAGDTLNLNMVNDSAEWAFFQVVYLTSGTAIEVATDFFDNVMDNVLNENSPPPPAFLILVVEADAMRPDGSLTQEVRLRQPREHVFICSASGSGSFQDDRVIYNAPESIRVAG
ncbi:MAG: hypothetical protein MJE66_24465 [Proteobacteria bacterium]|nr:hypothetical protein [Pseudomonadota bacterium]